MKEQFSRTARLLGEDAVQMLHEKHVAIFGLGGVGGYAAEALVRVGIGKFDLIDRDKVDISNLNRQIIATHATIGREKTEVMKERMLEINPDIRVTVHSCFFLPENAADFDFTKYDYVIDAVDTVTAKIELALCAQAAGVPIISSMGTGNKLNPAMLEVADLYRTSVCPLAKVMRRELKKRGIERLKVVYSKEEPIRPNADESSGGDTSGDGMQDARAGKDAARIPGSVSFVPSAAGLLIASEVVKDLIGMKLP